MQIMIVSPMGTRKVLELLRDWEPMKEVKYTLAKRKGATMLFDVSTPSGLEAKNLAERRLAEAGITTQPGFSMEIV